MRLDKYPADMSVGTRQEVKKMVRKCMVTVDGTIIRAAETKIDPDTQEICVMERPLAGVAMNIIC